MKSRNTILINLKYYSIILLLSLIYCSCSKDNNPVSPDEQNQKIYSEFEMLTDSLINDSKAPGLVVGVWAPDRNLEWVKAKGYSDASAKQNMKTTDLFRIGSITKTFTVTVVLQLVDEGKLTLDDNLNLFFPDFPNGDKITIRQLCNMTSGIFNYTESEEFINTLFSNLNRKFQPQELIDFAKNVNPYFQPGAGYHYSNTNTILLGMIIEKLTGKTIEEEIKERITDRLNLNNTYFPTEKNMPGEFAHGYQAEDSTGTILTDYSEMIDPSYVWSAGAMVSNINDLKTWIQVLAKGSLLSTRSQYERVQYVQINDYMGYGLGLFKIVGFIGHNGALPGYVTCAFYSPIKNTTIIVLFNSDFSADPTNFALKLIEVLYPDLVPNLGKRNALMKDMSKLNLNLKSNDFRMDNQ